ncbi:MAG: acyl--CoA ligase [Polyangiaceae bacterium]|nr:acyl--CoA ligase [Polyangiaceae bacterium]
MRPADSATPQLNDFLMASARRLPDKIALVCKGERLSYAEIDARSNALAHALQRRGVERGDRVIIYDDNSVEAVIAFWGVLKANAVVSLVHPQTRVERLSYLLNDCRAAALITSAFLAHTFPEAARRSPHLKIIVMVGKVDPPALDGISAAIVSFDEALAGEPSDRPPPRRNIDIDLAAIIYTSGSTGVPKGVMLTHRNMITAAVSISTYLENVEDDVILDLLPLSFDYGLYQMIMAFRMGARLILERGFTFPARILERVAEEKVTGFPGVPTIFAILSDFESIKEYDLSSVRYVTNTAAALPVKHILRLRDIFPDARIYSMYGLTECKRCAYLPPEDLARKPESVGFAIPNTELWIVDEDDDTKRLGPNQVGQLVIRGATVMKGYWEKPEATAKRLRPGPLPGEQVLYTGDLCRIDEEGYLYFVARMDDMLKVGGEKVAPKEVENALVSIPGVREAAVLGSPDALLGQSVKAFVVLEKNVSLTEKEILKACQGLLEGYKVPKQIVFRSDLPKTGTGKIQKAALEAAGDKGSS